MDYKDYYKTLGVSKQATDQQIKKAYRRMAAKYHPDVNPGNASAEKRFKEIGEAYEVLKDPEKRKLYDRVGANWKQYQNTQSGTNPFSGAGQYSRTGASGINLDDLFEGFAAGAGASAGSGAGAGGGFSDFFRTFFSGGASGAGGPGFAGAQSGRNTQSSQEKNASRDTEVPLEITLHEAYHGSERSVKIRGSRMNIRIPKGIEEGKKLKLSGKGQPDTQGKRGDLYLRIKFVKSGLFERKGHDIFLEQPIPLITAVLGGEVRVATLKGSVKLKIPAGTQPGDKFKLSGLGMPYFKQPDKFGHFYVIADIEIPKKLTTEAKKAFEKLRDLGL